MTGQAPGEVDDGQNPLNPACSQIVGDLGPFDRPRVRVRPSAKDLDDATPVCAERPGAPAATDVSTARAARARGAEDDRGVLAAKRTSRPVFHAQTLCVRCRDLAGELVPVASGCLGQAMFAYSKLGWKLFSQVLRADAEVHPPRRLPALPGRAEGCARCSWCEPGAACRRAGRASDAHQQGRARRSAVGRR